MKRLFESIQLTLFILLLPVFQGTAIAQEISQREVQLQFTVDPPWFHEPMIWIVGLMLTGLMVLVVMKERAQKIG